MLNGAAALITNRHFSYVGEVGVGGGGGGFLRVIGEKKRSMGGSGGVPWREGVGREWGGGFDRCIRSLG